MNEKKINRKNITKMIHYYTYSSKEQKRNQINPAKLSYRQQ